MIKKLLTGVVIAGVIGLAGYWAAAPVLTGQAIIRAAERGDGAALERLVDFPALRESMKGELNDLLVAEMRSDPRVVENNLGGLATMLGPMFISGAVDTVVTPQGVAAMVTTAKAPEADGTASLEPDKGRDEPDLHKAWGYRSLDVFAVTLTDRDRPENSLALLLERRGLFTWRLAAVDLRTQ
ncbi:DUF2939 domain-containing protein [uncultured Brevundimonas sp.]|uniref:DUF2939 domain-containing protein n=1 Tax=uncultured Brevundimonas sp. TaxID=213418 RepID=UPI0025DC9CBB|nr:DUF2939 domain-containing protein [uncultured Brevundimonas sp.]